MTIPRVQTCTHFFKMLLPWGKFGFLRDLVWDVGHTKYFKYISQSYLFGSVYHEMNCRSWPTVGCEISFKRSQLGVLKKWNRIYRIYNKGEYCFMKLVSVFVKWSIVQRYILLWVAKNVRTPKGLAIFLSMLFSL